MRATLLLLLLLALAGCSDPAPAPAFVGDYVAPALGEADRLRADATALETSRPAAAEELFRQVIALEPEDAMAHAGLARLLLARGDVVEAEALARRSVRLARVENDVYSIQDAERTLGQVLLGAGHEEGAREVFVHAMLDSDGSLMGCAYQGLGELYSQLREAEGPPPGPLSHAEAAEAFERGDYSRAIAGLDRSAGAGEAPAAHAALRGIFLLFEQRYARAEALFEEAEALEPGGPAARVGRGHLLVARKEHGQAADVLASALADMASEPAGADRFLRRLAWLGLGWAEANQNRHERALPWFERVLQERPEHRLGLLAKANSLAWLGRAEEAEALLRRLLELDPGDAWALAELAGIQLDRGELGAAEASYLAALEQRPDGYTCPYEGLGLVYLQLGRTDEAQVHFERAIAINPEIEYRKFNGLAVIHLAAGRTDEAVALLERSIANFPWDPEAARLLEEIRKR